MNRDRAAPFSSSPKNVLLHHPDQKAFRNIKITRKTIQSSATRRQQLPNAQTVPCKPTRGTFEPHHKQNAMGSGAQKGPCPGEAGTSRCCSCPVPPVPAATAPSPPCILPAAKLGGTSRLWERPAAGRSLPRGACGLPVSVCHNTSVERYKALQPQSGTDERPARKAPRHRHGERCTEKLPGSAGPSPAAPAPPGDRTKGVFRVNFSPGHRRAAPGHVAHSGQVAFARVFGTHQTAAASQALQPSTRNGSATLAANKASHSCSHRDKCEKQRNKPATFSVAVNNY